MDVRERIVRHRRSHDARGEVHFRERHVEGANALHVSFTEVNLAACVVRATVTYDPLADVHVLPRTVRLLPIRPRSRGERHSLRTFPVVTLHPRFPFNV